MDDGNPHGFDGQTGVNMYLRLFGPHAINYIHSASQIVVVPLLFADGVIS